MLRRYLIGGNWKCNGSVDFAKKFPTEVLKPLSFDPKRVEVVVAPSTVHIPTVQSVLAGTNVQLSTQNSSLFGDGAYTGETSPQMIKNLGLGWTILGHSERRHILGETDEVVGKKVKNALDNGL